MIEYFLLAYQGSKGPLFHTYLRLEVGYGHVEILSCLSDRMSNFFSSVIGRKKEPNFRKHFAQLFFSKCDVSTSLKDRF